MALLHSLSARERILRAAADRFAKEGYERARMVNVARSAGVSRAALYRHFPGKSDLLLALNDFLIAEWRDWLESTIAVAETACEAIEVWFRDALTDRWRLSLSRAVIAHGAEGDLLTASGATRKAILLGLQRNRASARPIVSLQSRRDIDALVALVLAGIRKA